MSPLAMTAPLLVKFGRGARALIISDATDIRRNVLRTYLMPPCTEAQADRSTR